MRFIAFAHCPPARRFRSIAVLAGLLTLLAASGCQRDAESTGSADAPAATAASHPDLIVLNGRVYTFTWDEPAADGTPAANAPRTADGWRPDAEALAVKGGLITHVGASAEIAALAGPDTTVIDIDGATVLPGLVDTHTHIFSLGEALSRVSLYDVETEAEAVERIVEAAKTVPKGEWIVGHGWDEGAWANRYPDMKLLTERVPDHPVYMRSLHSFAGWGNRLAFERAGITADTEAPVGGEIGRYPDGEPSGLLLNRAVPLLEAAIPKPDHAQLRARALMALEQMATDGYVQIHDAGLDTRHMAVLEDLEAAGELPIRVYAMLSVRDETLSRAWLEKGPDQDRDSFLVTRAVKAYYDGALGSRGARLLEDYSDRPGHRGVSGDQYGFNQALAAEMMAAGFQLGIHAIGDAGNRETLDFIESVYRYAPEARANRHRIEHAQVVHPDDMARFAELDLIASMEPPHAVEDKAWAEERLGPERIHGAYAWRTLRAAGARLTFNADNPGSDHDIFYGLHAAITRRDKAKEPTEGWYPDQNMTAEEALRGYTTWSAYAGFTGGRHRPTRGGPLGGHHDHGRRSARPRRPGSGRNTRGQRADDHRRRQHRLSREGSG
jgi:predicted amidohydrolase YtcJ